MERTEKTGAESFHTGRVVGISAAHAVHDTYTGFLAPLLPIFIENLGIGKTAAGVLRLCLQGPSLAQPLIGRLADRRDLRLLVVLAPAVTAALMSLLGLTNSYALLALFVLVVGCSSAGMHAVGPVLAGNLSGRSLGRGMSFWMVGGELGRTLGPVIIVATVQFLGLPGLPWVMIAGLVASGGLYVLLRDIPSTSSDITVEVAWWRAVRAMGPVLLPLSGIILARSFVLEAITTYLAIFMREEGAALWLAGIALTAVEAAGVVGALLGGSLSDRLGRRRVLAVTIAAGPVLLVPFLAVTIWPAAAGTWLQFPLLLLLGFTQLSNTPVMMALVQESYPQSRALANGAYMAANFGLRALVTVGVGILGDTVGLRVTFAVCAAIQLLALPLVWRLPAGPGPGQHESIPRG